MAYAILDKEIPATGDGRALTRLEIGRLRLALGRPVSNSSRVVWAGVSHRGHLYTPRDGKLSGGDVTLTVRA